jgi:glycosyltransferase involved in cell wall biosynthesis
MGTIRGGSAWASDRNGVMAIKVLLDGRPLRRSLSGVGQYVLHLARELGRVSTVDLSVLTFDFAGRANPLLPDLDLSAAGVRERRQRLIHRKLFNGVSAFMPFVPRELLGVPRQDVVHVTYFERFARPTGREAVVSTIHDVAFLRMPEMFPTVNLAASRRALADQVRRSDLLLTVSEFTRRELDELAGADPDRPALAAAQVARSRPYALFLGNIEPRKNLPVLIEAWRRSGLSADFELVVCGAPLHLESTSMRAIVNAEADGVVYLGYVSSEQKAALLAHAGCFVYPSVYEGFGIPVLEAMGSGVPVVTSTAVAEVGGTAALLVDPKDVDGLASALRAALTDDGLRMRMIENGLRRAAEFSWQRTAELTAHAYQVAVERHP